MYVCNTIIVYTLHMSYVIRAIPAWLPFGISAMVMLLVMGYVAFFKDSSGLESDLAFRIFQILLLLQLPLMLYVVASGKTRLLTAILLVGAQLAATIGAFVLVYWLHAG